MLSLIATLHALINDRLYNEDREKGATLVEYGLLVGLIAIVCIAAITLLGSNISLMFNRIGTSLSNVAN